MEHSFWHERWQSGRIAFHEGAPNALLETHWSGLGYEKARVFVPLCGKAIDLAWLAARGNAVTGAELDQGAVEAFFAEHDLQPEISDLGTLRRYAGGGITIYQGDIFELTAETLGPVDSVYDRAALVALPPEVRVKYAAHLLVITDKAPHFTVTFEYSNPAMQGPPFSVVADEVHRHYDATHDVIELDRRAITGSLCQRTEGYEVAWHMVPRES